MSPEHKPGETAKIIVREIALVLSLSKNEKNEDQERADEKGEMYHEGNNGYQGVCNIINYSKKLKYRKCLI